MFCEKCGNEISDELKFCEKCGSKVIKEEMLENSNEGSKITSSKKKKINKWVLITIFVLITSVCAYLFKGDREIELGETIEVEDIITLSFNNGNFFDKEAYSSNATNESVGLEYDGDGKMFALYGTVENTSLQKYDLNKVIKAKFIFADKYETKVDIWLENTDGTEFEGLDTGDLVWLDPNATLNPKAKRKCTIIGKIGEEIYTDTNDVTVKIQILKSLDDDDYYTYTMPLIID